MTRAARRSTALEGAAKPSAAIMRVATMSLGVRVALVLLVEGTDAIRRLRLWSSPQLASRWAGIKRRQRTEARRAVLGEVAARVLRSTGRPA